MGDLGLISGLGRSPGVVKDYPPFRPGQFHGSQRVGHNWVTFHFSRKLIMNMKLPKMFVNVYLPGEISITSNVQMIIPLWQKVKKNWRASWWNWKRRVKNLAWNSAFKKLRSWHPVPSLHGKKWGSNGNSDRLYFLGLQNYCRWWLQPWSLKTLAPWKKSYN